MELEKEIFKRSNINYNKLLKYGFKKVKDKYIYEKSFLDNEFKAIIYISNGIVEGKVIDLETNEEYLGLRTKMNGEFVNKVREEYKSILIDIKKHCFDNNNFIFNQTNRINDYIINKHDVKPEFLWEKTPGCGVYRNKDNNKWFGIIMNIDMSKLDNKTGEVEIINIKLNEETIQKLLKRKGFYKAYHMNKKSWITIVLNDTLDDSMIKKLIDESYDIINNTRG